MCCIVVLQAITIIRDDSDEETDGPKHMDSFDIDLFGQNEEDDSGEAAGDVGGTFTSLEEPQSLDPEVEMLPAHFGRVRPPGVDHMEIQQGYYKKPGPVKEDDFFATQYGFPEVL